MEIEKTEIEKTEDQEDAELREAILKHPDVRDVQKFIGNWSNVRSTTHNKIAERQGGNG